MDTEPFIVDSLHIQAHLAYWYIIEEIRAARTGVVPRFKTDEELLDLIGVSRESMRLAKCSFRESAKEDKELMAFISENYGTGH